VARIPRTVKTPARASSAALRELAQLRLSFGVAAATRRRACFAALERATLLRAGDVLALHELLCFARAYPDDRRTLAIARRLLRNFARRPDLKRHRDALEDSGIAVTRFSFRYFAETTNWLAERWPQRLSLDWDAFEDTSLLEALLPLLVTFAESPGIEEYDYGLRGWVERLKAPGESDAVFLVRRLAQRIPDAMLHEKLSDSVDAPFVLDSDDSTPSRTHALATRGASTFHADALPGGRPDLVAALARAAFTEQRLGPREGRRMIDLALCAMVTRSRDLDVFAYADPADVRLVDCGDGLSFACIGVKPPRRLLLESVYGFLTLKNRVPVGYVLISALYGSSELAYNVFETFRGAEASAIYARVLSVTHQLFGSDTFTIYPYQLGEGNDEALASGAWWFYRKLGFMPRDAAVVRLMHAEEARMRRNRAHRSSRATLKRLASANLYWSAKAQRRDVIGILPLARAGLAVSRALSRRFGADRGRAEMVCDGEARERVGVASMHDWSRTEREMWRRWSPLVALLPGIESWSDAERSALAAVVRAKGGRCEGDYVARFDAHPALRASLRRLIERTRE
jgi:hypothetical protein